MKRLPGVLFIAAAACATAAAPQTDTRATTAQSQPDDVSQTDQARPIKPEFKFAIDVPRTTTRSSERDWRQQRGTNVIVLPPQWVFKDGALYLDLLGNGALVPVPGGGASGCFDANLRVRIEKLKTAIEAFPARPAPVTPRQ